MSMDHEYEYISFLDTLVERGILSPINADHLVKMYKSAEKRAERNYARYQVENYRLGLLLGKLIFLSIQSIECNNANDRTRKPSARSIGVARVKYTFVLMKLRGKKMFRPKEEEEEGCS